MYDPVLSTELAGFHMVIVFTSRMKTKAKKMRSGNLQKLLIIHLRRNYKLETQFVPKKTKQKKNKTRKNHNLYYLRRGFYPMKAVLAVYESFQR